MKVTVDDDRCKGHGVCVAICPDVFDLTDYGYAEAMDGDVPDELKDEVLEAIQQCPEHAISEI